MAWNLSGDIYESCSCNMACRCTLGPAEPDQGWCSFVQIVEVREGRFDDVELNGARYAFAADLPGDFFSGFEKARLYFDDGTTSTQQREALEAIYQGKAGGFWAGMQEIFKEWLPSKVAPIQLSVTDDGANGSVGGAAELQLAFVKTEDGKQAKLVNAPVSAGVGIESVDLGTANGTRGTDPDLRAWESLGFGGHSSFDWRS